VWIPVRELRAEKRSVTISASQPRYDRGSLVTIIRREKTLLKREITGSTIGLPLSLINALLTPSKRELRPPARITPLQEIIILSPEKQNLDLSGSNSIDCFYFQLFL
jgi:hypothetical protein